MANGAAFLSEWFQSEAEEDKGRGKRKKVPSMKNSDVVETKKQHNNKKICYGATSEVGECDRPSMTEGKIQYLHIEISYLK